MDMSGVELSVANAHLQVQRVEDEVLKPYMDDMYRAQEDHRVLEESLRDRVDSLELEKDRVEANCASVREVLSSWMVTFEALETSVGNASKDVRHMEDHLVVRSKEFLEMVETVKDQASTIRLLQDCVGELELGHGVLRTRVANIEVGR
jgi:hypothetical protein